MMRPTEDALPSGNAFLAAAAGALIASRSSSRMAHGLQCNQDMRLCGRDAGDQRSRTSRESSTAAAMTSDMWSGVLRSGAASMESSPCGKGRAGAVREGIMVRASGGGAGRGESLGGSESAGVSEDEHSRKRRYGSISSASSLEPTEFAVWHAGSPSRQRIFASAPEVWVLACLHARAHACARAHTQSTAPSGFPRWKAAAAGRFKVTTGQAEQQQQQQQQQQQASDAAAASAHQARRADTEARRRPFAAPRLRGLALWLHQALVLLWRKYSCPRQPGTATAARRMCISRRCIACERAVRARPVRARPVSARGCRR